MLTRFYVAKLTAENIDEIVAHGATHHLNLEDFRDDITFNAEDGFETFVLVTVGKAYEGSIAYTTLTDAGLRELNYRYTGATYAGLYDRIKFG